MSAGAEVAPFFTRAGDEAKVMIAYRCFMGRGFTSGGQDSGSVFSASVCKYRLVNATLSPCH